MQDRWLEKNINLNTLTQQIKQFFTEKQFTTTTEQKTNQYKIEAATQKILNIQLKIKVEIIGQPNNFTINYTTNQNNKRLLSSPVVKYFAWALGGGIIILKQEKAREALEKFENNFWSYVDEKIAQLTRKQDQ